MKMEMFIGLAMLVAVVFIVVALYEVTTKEKEDEYEPPSQIDRINNNLREISETLSEIQEEQTKKRFEVNIREGYRVKLRVADGHTAFSGTRYTVTEHLIEADNFVNDGDWITLYKKDKKVATHPTEQVEFITKL